MELVHVNLYNLEEFKNFIYFSFVVVQFVVVC